ncbi:MAG: glycine cleavage T C-terminal barrel domain-containing protein [Pirellulaceae bacterium]
MSESYDSFFAGRGYVRIENLTIVRMTGGDRVTVLNNFCTADIKRLAVDRGTEAFITDVRGRTLGHVCAFALANELLLIGNGQQGERVANHIDRYIIREDAAIIDISSEMVGWLISGRQKGASFNAGKMATSPSLACGAVGGAMPESQWFQVPWTSDNDSLILTRASETDAVREWLAQCGYASCDSEAFQIARIEAGWPVFGVDCSDANLPQEIDRNAQAISFTKGCYLGQETVARLDALGQVQKKLVRMRIDGQAVPTTGTQLMEGEKTCGEIRSATFSPTLREVIAIGYVRRRWFDPGAQLTVAGSGQTATVSI